MRKVFSMLVALLLIFTISPIILPANAANYQSQSDVQAQKIQELASLAGQAARDGNYELANSYENSIRSLGAEILTYNDVVSFVAKMKRISPFSVNVNPPPDSAYVHFTKKTTTGYNYAGKSYDIITITAVSWSDLPGYLHSNGAAKTNSHNQFNLIGMVGSDVLATTTFGSITNPLMTMWDYFNAIGDSMSNYTEMSINEGDGVCLYTIDMDVNFQWIRPHGNGDYRMMLREARYSEINYSTSILASVKHKNGKVDTYAKSHDYRTESQPSGFGSLSRVCQAYLNDKIAEYPAESFTIEIGTTEVPISPMTIPPYMDII